MPDVITILYGCVIGFSLGLTGGGGSIFAVPLLIYGLGTGVREAVGISLAAVGSTALFGALMRLKSGELDFRRGLAFALMGMAGATVGTWIGALLSPQLVLQTFAILMVIIGWRMWVNKDTPLSKNAAVEEYHPFQIATKQGAFFLLVGFAAGILSGIFGVGGGFIIVPALTLVGGMDIRRAIPTSLMVISLICLSGIASYIVSGDHIPLRLTTFFVAGGLVGILLGNLCRSKLKTMILKKTFATAMWIVSIYVFVRS